MKKVILVNMGNKTPQSKLNKKRPKRNLHIPNVSEIFASKNGTSYWLPIGSNNKSPIKINTTKQALKWANE